MAMLSSPRRCEILRLTWLEERSAGDIHRAMPDVSFAAVSQQLRLLAETHGALSVGLRHKDVYAAIASHSGVDALLYAGPHPYAKGQVKLADDPLLWGKEIEPLGGHIRAIFGKDLENWRAHDPRARRSTRRRGGRNAARSR